MLLKPKRLAPHSTTDYFMLSTGLIDLYHLPKLFCGNKSHSVVIKIAGANQETIDFNTDNDIIKALERLKQVSVPQPHILKFEKGSNERDIKISHSPKIEITLPYVFNYYNFTYDATSELWTFKVWYKHPKSSAEVEKEFTVKAEDDIEAQSKAIQTAVNAQIEKPYKFSIESEADVIKDIKMSDNLQVHVPADLARRLNISSTLTSTSGKTDKRSAWITSNIADDMIVGNASYQLLSPMPLSMSTHALPLMHYVRAKLSRFSTIEINMFSDLYRSAPFEDARMILLVLHFVPTRQLKRKYVTDELTTVKRQYV